jgi:hypothetical protein
VPSTSKTIPFRRGALCTLGLFGSSGANLRGPLGPLVTVSEAIDTLKDVRGAEQRGVNWGGQHQLSSTIVHEYSTALKRDERRLTKSDLRSVTSCP